MKKDGSEDKIESFNLHHVKQEFQRKKQPMSSD